MFAGLTLAAFFIGTGLPLREIIDGALLVEENALALTQGRTLAFMVLALCQIVQAYNMRSEHSLFKIGVFKNKTLNLAALASTLLVALVLFTPVGVAFGMITLTPKLYLLGLGLIFVPLVVMEICKLFGSFGHKK